MTAGVYNTVIEQGATFRRVIRNFKIDDDLVDLSGYTARMQIREKVASPTVLFSLTTENDGITLSTTGAGPVTANSISLYLSSDDTSLFRSSTGVYDIELIQPGGDVIRLLEGTLTNSKEVTR